MDRIRILFRNPEIKKIIIKMFIVVLLVMISIVVLNYININRLNVKLLDKNAALILALSDIEGVDPTDVVDKFYNELKEEDIIKGREILDIYNYNEDLDISKNALVSTYKKESLCFTVIPIVIITLIGIVIVLLDLWKIYNKLRTLSNKADDMVQGRYYKIEEENEEGEISILVNSLNNMGDRINNTLELLNEDKIYLKEYLSDISHQIKTPLTSLIMLNEIMINDDGMELSKRSKFLEKSKEELERMEWLILNLLKMGRLEGSVIEFNIEENNVMDVVELAISSLGLISDAKNQELIVKCKKEEILKCDREWLAEAISNIVKNAIEHTDEYGRVEIEFKKGKLIDKLYIRDNGIGMDEDRIKNIFKRFYKGEGRVNPKNIGIGLSLSKAIIEKMNGEIKVFSEKGKGTEFIITFIKI